MCIRLQVNFHHLSVDLHQDPNPDSHISGILNRLLKTWKPGLLVFLPIGCCNVPGTYEGGLRHWFFFFFIREAAKIFLPASDILLDSQHTDKTSAS